jgi:hypothetical protein
MITNKTNRKPRRRCVLGSHFLAEHALQSRAVFSEFLDPLVEFVECHLILKKRPAEFRLVVDIGDFGNRLSLCSSLCAKLPGNRIGAVLEFLKERRSDSEEVYARECQDLADLE